MSEILNLSTEIAEQAKQASEALGIELNNIKIEKLGAKAVVVSFQLNDWSQVNE